MSAPTVRSALPGRQPRTTASTVRTRLTLIMPVRSPGQVGRRGLLGDDALGLVQPVLGVGRGAYDVGQCDGSLDVRLERGAALVVGALEQDLVVEGQQVEGVIGRRRLLGQARDARRRRVDALAERVERGGDDLAVEDVAPGGKTSSGK